jgi:5-methylcytosine-specific restriction enzyme A
MGNVVETRWEQLCQRQLREHPLCAYCLERLVIQRAVLCAPSHGHHRDMIISLCRECYVATEAYIAQYGYRPDIGIDGWPLDPKHPHLKEAPSPRTSRRRHSEGS